MYGDPAEKLVPSCPAVQGHSRSSELTSSTYDFRLTFKLWAYRVPFSLYGETLTEKCVFF